MTTSSLSQDQLKQQIRVRLAQGRLPVIDGAYNTRRGTGRPCIVCRREIGRTEMEYELDDIGVVLIAHDECYMLWREGSVSHGAERRP